MQPESKVAVLAALMFCVQQSIFGVTPQNVNNSSDTDLTTAQMIRKAGYPAEAHTVETQDGYLLTMHRIPGNASSSPVFLQHGLLGSSADWVISGKTRGLAFILAEKGYDVWLGNFRGNTYSRAHTTLSISDSAFWNFSFHELGVYDLPSMILYVVGAKKGPLTAYIGHSMGTTAFYVMASTRTEMVSHVQSMLSLAPVAYVQHLKSPIRFLAPLVHDYEAIAHFLGKDEFLPQNAFIRFLARYGCDITVWEEKICANILFAICGFDRAQFNYTLLPAILAHSPAGASTKTLMHYAQEITSGMFRQYDFGTKGNIKVYNTTVPPNYDLSKIAVPIILFYSDNDWLASPLDVMKLSRQLPILIEMYRVPFSKFNHLDYLWAIDAPKLVYQRLLYVLEKYRRQRNRCSYKKISTS